MSTKHLIFTISGLIAIIQLLFVLEGDFITYFYAAASYLSLLFCTLLSTRIRKRIPVWPYRILLAYLVLGCVAILRGFGEASNYWDWKQFLLNNAFIMLLPLISLIGSNAAITQIFLQNYIKMLPIGILVFFFSRFSDNSDGFGRYMSPLYFFVLMLPYLAKKYVILIIILSLASFFSDMEARSNMIRFVIAGILSISSYIYSYCPRKLLISLYVVIFMVPFFLFASAYAGLFNIFSMDDYAGTELSVNGKDSEPADLLADTRTFIYQEQLSSLVDRNRLWIGESASAGYESIAFSESSLTSKGRAASEVGLLNVIMYNGLIGGIIFSLLFFVSGLYCLWNAQNRFSISLSFFIAFRWLYSWVEEFTNYDLNYFFLWLMLGFCLSRDLSKMNESQIRIWLNRVFPYSKVKLSIHENCSFNDML